MTDAARARRLADQIREIAAGTLEFQIKDPRLGFVTITDARLTADLRDATLYYTVYGDDEARAGTAAALESARGVVRAEIGRQARVRYTPTVTFVADEVPDTAKHIDDLLARARAADAAVSRVAEGAQPAGDPDPYRVPRATEDSDPDPGAPA
ncbi:MAG: 30S ribosome-binding factor RbfA [Actinomycetota bacterium]|nr:30S ribosome-binding factor RbfA [Actinomycetota bacterium]